MHQVWTLRHSFWHECKPWTHSTDCKNVCSAQSLSRLFWKMFPEQETNKISLEVCTFFKSSIFWMSWKEKTDKSESNLGELKLLAFRITFLASLSLTWNPLPTNSKPPLPSCKVNSQDIQTQTRVAQAACPQPISWLARKTWTHGWRKSIDKVLAEQTT